MDPKTVVLVGEAAQSYVQLQWTKFYVDCVFVPMVVIGLGYLAWYLIKSIREDC